MAKIKTKARALDMLGRQQIAGIPTALSELFKNAHDAYADNVEVDYIRKDNLLILRDDGLGMTRAEFEERWLTIGTDSKLIDEDSIEMPGTDNSKPSRPIMGEKGIGRLAIASIGPQVLVITRSKKDGIVGNIVAAFVNWTLFSLPKLDLDDIYIPIIELESGELLNKHHVDSLVNDLVLSVKSLENKIARAKIDALINQIKSFCYDPEYWDSALNRQDVAINIKREHLSFRDNGSGTHFIISPVDEVLADDISTFDMAKRTDQASRLEKALLGFTNTMYESSHAPIVARFRDHTLDGECIDRISESVFFTPEEFSSADHHFKGEFNCFGQFVGTIKVYGDEREVIVPWPDGRGMETLCGCFKLNLAYLHGMQKDSRLSPELWKELRDKTDRWGGLYVYRDGIRILPYGDSDMDFLRIEQRRSKSASEYFFSYRRMFGAIELTKENSYELKEKAGREGFIENKAYKQLKSILENFFIQVAADYFTDKGDRSAVFLEARARNQREYDVLKKREQHKKGKKKKFSYDLERFFDSFDKNEFESQINSVNEKVSFLFDSFNQKTSSLDELAVELDKIKQSELPRIIKKMDIVKPNGVGFTKDVMEQWDLYQSKKNLLIGMINECKAQMNSRLISLEENIGNVKGLRNRFYDSLVLLDELKTKEINNAINSANKVFNELQEQVRLSLIESKSMVKAHSDKVLNDFYSVRFNESTAQQLFDMKSELEIKIEESTNNILSEINLLTERLLVAKEGSAENITSSSEVVSILETEYELIKEQHDKNLQLAQLGMALGVLGHEFNTNILIIRRAINEMQPFAARNERFNAIYNRVRVSFEHLDAHIKTLIPLTRRVGRRRAMISGKSISEFIESVFAERLDKEKIELRATEEFYNQKIYTFPSSIYPVFINLIDNSIHWLSKSSGERIISLDATENGFLVMDSGPGIPTIDQNNVFEFGFSRRIGGQGMGLYVAKQTLEKEGFALHLEPYRPDRGATFYIEPEKNTEE